MATTEPQPPAPTADPPRAPPSSTRRSWALGLLLGVAVVLLVGFPIAARLAADEQPLRPPTPVVLSPLPAGRPGPVVRELPVLATVNGVPGGPATPDRTAVGRDAIDLLGPAHGRQLAALLRSPAESVGAVGDLVGGYPYRYRSLERILGPLPQRLSSAQVARATALAAQLLVGPGHRPNDAPIAFALLDRARAGGACAPQLDLLLVVAAQDPPVESQARREAQRAQRACPRDPTPSWLLGQLQLQLDDPGARATFRRLEREFPRSAAGWSGDADVKLVQAAFEPSGRVFVARRLELEALLRLRRAARLDGDPGLHAGIAIAQFGLGLPRDAATSQRRAIDERPRSAAVAAALVEYLEQAHDFGAAAVAADRLRAMAGGFAPGSALYPLVPTRTLDEPLGTLAAGAPRGPLSLGAGRLAPLTVQLYATGHVAPTASVADLSFIPEFRPWPSVTGSERWCPQWAAQRDLLLTGRRERARTAPTPSSAGPWECNDASLLAGIGDLEAGDRGALRRRRDELGDALRLGEVEDARQDLWRWARKLPQAEHAARDWARQLPGDPKPWLRLGEIEYLRRHYDGAVVDFGTAIRRARDRTGTWSVAEADGLLHRGAALVAAGRRAEGIATFGQADEVGSRALALGTDPSLKGGDFGELQAESIVYHARASAADAQLDGGNVNEAAESYAAAREYAHKLAGDTPEDSDIPFGRLDNNEAIADLRLGHIVAAREHARAAVAIDPLDPAFLMTAAYVEARGGRLREAARLNRAALGADPTAYPAANDLGVLLARLGDKKGAVRALRRAVGGNRDYALAWFNLSVVYGRMGPTHILASQGALARAIKLDEEFRGRKPQPTLDASTYRTGLDLSRPLPPEWTFAGSQGGRPAAVAGGAAILLLTITLGRSLAARRSGRAMANEWLEPLGRAVSRVPLLGRMSTPALGALAAFAILAWQLTGESGGGATAALTLIAGLALLVAVVLLSRVLVARRARTKLRQATWPPALVFAVGAAAAGFAWVPLPFVSAPGEDMRLRRAAPAAAGLLGIALVGLAAWLDIPITRALATAALVMAASLLTPIAPLDGSMIAKAGAAGASLAALSLGALALIGIS
jgi:tetratricopeptide (TPR) repeat protein